MSQAAEGADSDAEADPLDPRRSARRIGRAKLDALIERPDRERPAKRLSVPVFGRPLTIGGRYTSVVNYEDDRLLDFDFLDLDDLDLDGDGNDEEPEDAARGLVPEDDLLRVNQALLLDLFYPVTEDVSVYLGGRGFYRNLVRADHARERDEWVLERGESWLYFANLFGTPFSLQAGNQAFFDEREWWWDATSPGLDALRLRFDVADVHAEFSGSRQLFPTALGEGGKLEPEEEGIYRLLGALNWQWRRRQQIGLYALYQWDESRRHHAPPPVGRCLRDIDGDGVRDDDRLLFLRSPFFQAGCIDPESQDESDARLTWFGASASGRWKLGRPGTLHYWANVAGVYGREVFHDFSGNPVNRAVRVKSHNDVEGWGVDAWLTWQTKLPFRPRLTAGYARGSGERRMREETDTGFRQTGLQDNSDRWRGVDSFHYYGELLDPDLSNLQIYTAALGFPLLRKSSIELVYHRYRQVRAAPFLHDVAFKRDPDGRHRAIGDEFDVVLGVEEWAPFLEIELVGAAFRTGRAFAPKHDRINYLGIFQVRLNF